MPLVIYGLHTYEILYGFSLRIPDLGHTVWCMLLQVGYYEIIDC